LTDLHPERKLDDSQLLCQALFFHAWMPSERVLDIPPQWDLGIKGYVLALQCARCGSLRMDVIDGYRGELAWRVYRYPEGWVHFKMESKPTVPELRLELMRRNRKVGK